MTAGTVEMFRRIGLPDRAAEQEEAVRDLLFHGVITAIMLFGAVALFATQSGLRRDAEVIFTGAAMGIPAITFRAPACKVKQGGAALVEADTSVTETLSSGRQWRKVF